MALALAALAGFTVGALVMAGYGWAVAFLTIAEDDKRARRAASDGGSP